MRSLIREIRKEKQLLLILSSWFLAGLYLPVAGYLFVPLSFLFFIKKRQFSNIFVGLLFLFVMSDNRIFGSGFPTALKPVIVVVVSLFLYLNRRNFKIQLVHPFFSSFVLFLFIAFFSLVFSPSSIIFSGIYKTISYLLLLWSVPIIVILGKRQSESGLYNKVIIAVFVLLLSSLLLNYVNPIITNLSGRYRGWFGNPNGLGIFITLFVAVLLVIRKQKKTILNHRWILIFVSGVVVVSLLKCSSQTALVAIAILLLFYKMKIQLLSGIFVTIIAAISMQLIIDNIELIALALNLEDYARLESLREAGGRTVGLSYGWEEIKKEWYIIGKGFNYTNYFYYKNFEELIALNHVGNAHNSYITAWLDTGLIGLILFLIAWFKQFKRCWSSQLCFPIMFSILFSSFFESWLVGSLNPFTIVLIFILVSLQDEKHVKKGFETA